MLNTGRRFFTQRVIGLWNRLPREVIIAPTFTEFSKCLDSDLRYMEWFLGIVLCRPRIWTQLSL